MYEALSDLAKKMDEKHLPPAELNVIGGFALMLHGVRPTDGITDIDYVGNGLSDELNALIEETGLKHGMEPGWINKDGMASGIGMSDFELSTGELHFTHAVDIGGIHINILEEKDLLRLKVIAVDTAMTELEATGKFARVKDFHDIHDLMERLDMSPEKAIREYADYMICYPDTGDLLHAIAKGGPDGGLEMIENKKKGFKEFMNGIGSESIVSDASDLGSLLDNLNSLIDGLKGL